MCSLFAATYPEKTLALVMIGSYAIRIRDVDYPWAPTSEQRQNFFTEMLEGWGGPVGLEERAPSVADDPKFREIARGRDHLHADLTREVFEAECQRFFEPIRVACLGETHRWLYLFRKRLEIS